MNRVRCYFLALGTQNPDFFLPAALHVLASHYDVHNYPNRGVLGLKLNPLKNVFRSQMDPKNRAPKAREKIRILFLRTHMSPKKNTC